MPLSSSRRQRTSSGRSQTWASLRPTSTSSPRTNNSLSQTWLSRLNSSSGLESTLERIMFSSSRSLSSASESSVELPPSASSERSSELRRTTGSYRASSPIPPSTSTPLRRREAKEPTDQCSGSLTTSCRTGSSCQTLTPISSTPPG